MINIKFDKQTPHEIFTKAKNEIENNNGALLGNDKKGTFNIPTTLGKITGSYSIEANEMNIVILHKPLMVGDSLIEMQLKKYLK